jgi:xylose isomerase
MASKKYSIILGNLGNTCDRFCSGGYKDNPDTMTMLKSAARIGGVTGAELVGTWDIRPDNVNEMRAALADLGLTCASIIPDHFAQKVWGKGAFISRDAAVRRKAIDATLEACELAKKLNCGLINIWNGQDGYDYPLQADYMQERDWLRDGVRECAEKFPDVRFALEYKMKEPRTHSYLARMADTLLVCQEVGTRNVGVTIDVGHSLLAYENVAEAVVLAKRAGDKLFHMHFNDNYRSWDDDMIVGSIHTVEYFELLYWLDRVGYKGWLSMDQYPYREDAVAALSESVAFLRAVQAKVDACRSRIDALLKEGDPTKSSALMREMLLK